MLAYKTADRLIGRTDLPAHVFDTLVDTFELGTHLVEQHTRLTIQIWVSGDVSHRIVDFAPAFVGDDDLERVFETASAVGFAKRSSIFVMVCGEDAFHTQSAGLHTPAERVAVVPFGQGKLT